MSSDFLTSLSWDIPTKPDLSSIHRLAFLLCCIPRVCMMCTLMWIYAMHGFCRSGLGRTNLKLGHMDVCVAWNRLSIGEIRSENSEIWSQFQDLGDIILLQDAKVLCKSTSTCIYFKAFLIAKGKDKNFWHHSGNCKVEKNEFLWHHSGESWKSPEARHALKMNPPRWRLLGDTKHAWGADRIMFYSSDVHWHSAA